MTDDREEKWKSELSNYKETVQTTDRLPSDDLKPVLLGLLGEVGSITAAAKKLRREKKAFPLYREAALEEFGDALWYLVALCKRLNIDLADLIEPQSLIPPQDKSALDKGGEDDASQAPDVPLLMLAHVTADVIDPAKIDELGTSEIKRLARAYFEALHQARLDLTDVIQFNTDKAVSRFGKLDMGSLPIFDQEFQEEERLPEKFEIEITQRASGKSYLRMNGIFVGDPLTDNIAENDDYRFHDVFHFAFAAVLHWSPVMRALLKQKRKSRPDIDEAQDGGRAIVVEEGLAAWLFTQAKALDYFKDQTSVSYDILKTIGGFVKGYEVEQCPLKLWEHAILQGYDVFRQVRDNQGGIVVGNRGDRSIVYRPLDGRSA